MTWVMVIFISLNGYGGATSQQIGGFDSLGSCEQEKETTYRQLQRPVYRDVTILCIRVDR